MYGGCFCRGGNVHAQDPVLRRERQVGSAGKKKEVHVYIERCASPWYTDYLSASPRYTSSHSRDVFRTPIRLYHVLEQDLPLAEVQAGKAIPFM